jgi:hypothetical protein
MKYGMAKLLKKTFGLGAKKTPPQPPKPDYNVAGGAVGGVAEDDDAFNRDGEQEANSGSPTSSARNAQVQSSSPTPQNRIGLAVAAGLPVLSPRSSSIGGHGHGATGFSDARPKASSSSDGKVKLCVLILFVSYSQKMKEGRLRRQNAKEEF